MLRSGTVCQIVYHGDCGVIRDNSGNEFYFNLGACVEGELPRLNSRVTFVRDKDFKNTLVADLVQTSKVQLDLEKSA